jgi:hypothetical protein
MAADNSTLPKAYHAFQPLIEHRVSCGKQYI